MLNNLRNKLKILLKVSKEENSLNFELSKVSSLVSQFGIEDSTLLDYYILKKFNLNLDNYTVIYKNINFEKLKLNFFCSFNILIFRDDEDSLIILDRFNLGSLYKYLFDSSNKKSYNNLYNFFLIWNLSSSTLFYNNFLNFNKNILGTLKTYKYREKMKARKINFRRKLKKNSYDE